VSEAIFLPNPMEERFAPSRPYRLGTRRRRARSARVLTAGGASRPRQRPASLDTEKQLQKTVREWLRSEESEKSLYRRQLELHTELFCTYHKLWQDYARAGNEPESVKWEKKALRLRNCRYEWIGFRADCCKSMTQPLAVPVGCNDRMCPLCAYDRSRAARKRIKTMFDRLTHPVLLTLTIPNLVETIHKRHFEHFRKQVRKLLAQYAAWARGGLYSIETTYNRVEKSWHIHAHVLLDASFPLPLGEYIDAEGNKHKNRVKVAGRNISAFNAFKMRLEFDWLRIVTGGWGKSRYKTANLMGRAGEEFLFNQWAEESWAHSIRVWSNREKKYVIDSTLSPREIARRTAWNRENRRVIDVRTVTDRERVAYEVLKYITKIADFGDLPEAVEPFANAVHGARLIQTFGTWYGVKIDAPPETPMDWEHLKCACGLNCWKRIGVFYNRDVEMDEEGRWLLKRVHDHNSAGTVPRPTIRALEAREE
jgi:Replication protein/Transposase zinc-binding domain